MARVTAGVAAGAVLAAIWFTPASTARADSDTFLAAVAALGHTDRTEALRNGYTVCVMRTEADADLTDRVIRGALSWLNRDAAAQNTDEFSALAVQHLCPELAAPAPSR